MYVFYVLKMIGICIVKMIYDFPGVIIIIIIIITRKTL